MTFLISVVAQSTTIFLRCGVHCNTPSSTRLSTRYFASGREQSLLSVISLAFRHIPVAESDYWLLGFFWDGTFLHGSFPPVRLTHSTFSFRLIR